MRELRITFTKKEKEDLLKAWGLISLAFTILFAGTNATPTGYLITFVISILTVGLGFLLHELAHKIVAIHYGCTAQFQANMKMLLLAVGMSFFGFIFAAPGAVMIQGHITRKQHGHIAAAGPATNVILALLFLATTTILPAIGTYGMAINAFLALFNLLPLPGMDGNKVWTWNKAAYLGLAILSGGLVMLSYI